MRLLIRRLTNRFWFIPSACVLIAVFSGIAMSNADNWIVRHTNLPFLFEGGPEGARALLSAIITSMISFTGLVFSITVVVLQLTSSQFSPRVLRGFLDDRFNQFALGVFVATFTFALVVLRSVRGTAEIDPFVPYFSVTTASVLVLVSVAVFLGYINHISQSIRAAAIISHVATDTAGMIKDLDDQSDRSEQDTAQLPEIGSGSFVNATGAGVIQAINNRALLDFAERNGISVRLLRSVGEFTASGTPLLEIYGTASESTDPLVDHVILDTERSLTEDIGFGFRQLVDIAERALSPGINDPTTAIQAIDQIHDLLARLGRKPNHIRQLRKDDSTLGVHIPVPEFTDYLDLAVNEIASMDESQARVGRRVCVMLLDLQRNVLAEHRSAVSEAHDRHCRHCNVAGESWPQPSDVGFR